MTSSLEKPSEIDEIFAFWFGDAQSEDVGYEQRRKLWFSKNLEVDRTIHDRFCTVYGRAVAGNCESWRHSSHGCLALLLLFDQFPRNMFRGMPQAFAADPLALDLAQATIAQSFDQALPPIQRIFVYLPFEHSEAKADQQRSIELFAQLSQIDPEFTDVFNYAQRHKAVIDRFGRFPHRNAILDRPSTKEEIEFLNQPGSAF